MAYPVMPFGFLGSQGDNDSYQISKSLRFNSADSAYVSKTYASGTAATTLTISCWIKRSSLSTTSSIFASRSGSTVVQLEFASDDKLSFVGTNSAGSITMNIKTSDIFRYVAAWYHLVLLVDTTQATASDRVKIYINGSQITSFTTSTYPPQNSTFATFGASEHSMGARLLTPSGVDSYFSGYLTETIGIDGQALTPYSFGETDTATGRWKAKTYSGAYGTNGFYLKFADNSGTTSITLGKDSSPNGNNWTPNNFSVDNTTSNGINNDSLVESPTNYGTDTGLGGEVCGNYCTFNPLKRSSTYANLSNGNLTIIGTTGGAGQQTVQGTIAISSGKWYAEAIITTVGAESAVGIARVTQNTGLYVGNGAYSYGYYFNGNRYNNSSGSAYGASYTSGDVIGIAFNADTGVLVFYKNGISQGNAFTGLQVGDRPAYVFEGHGRSATSGNQNNWNFGQRPWKYPAPSGFKALCTTNLPTPTIKKPSSYMDVITFTATGANQSITGLNFSPDLVWIKNRATWAGNRHTLYDTTRTLGNRLDSSTTEAEAADNDLYAFNADGFSGNYSGTTYVAWNWKKLAIAGMDIVSYSGTGVARTVPHNLGVAPKMIIAKLTNSAGFNWPVYHSSLTSASSYLYLNSTIAQATDATYWGTAPTSSVFSVGTNANVNNNTSPYIAYCFAEVEGFSKFGSYVGNGLVDGPFAWCGFRPRFVMIKTTGSSLAWIIYDTARSTSNLVTLKLAPNNSQEENGSSIGGTTFNTMDIFSNGFKLRSTNIDSNQSGVTFIFAAFAESPFKYARAR